MVNFIKRFIEMMTNGLKFNLKNSSRLASGLFIIITTKFMKKKFNHFSAFQKLKPKQLLGALVLMSLLSSCSDLIEGGLSIGYGVVTILLTLLKWGFIIGGALFVIAFIVSLFNKNK